MHIPENYLSPATCGVMGAAMIPVWSHSIKTISKELPKEKMPLLGVGAAFSFLAMMFNVPLIGGTTGHAVGGTLVALLFGPEAACIAVSIALLIQAVLFGDGGILAFGANCFNMAFVLPFTGYYIYRLIAGQHHATSGRISGRSLVGAAVGSYLGLALAALFAAVEFGLQPILFHDAAGLALYCPYDISIAVPAMMIPHLLVAGFVEAAFTVAVFAFVAKTSPDMIYENWKSAELSGGPAPENGRTSHFPVFALVAGLIVATPLGLLASGTAWGEWGADEIADITSGGKALGYTPEGLANGWSLESIMPDYTLSGMGEVTAYILSAIIGVALLITFFKLISIPMKNRRTRA